MWGYEYIYGYKDPQDADVITDTIEKCRILSLYNVSNESITLSQYFSLTITLYRREYRLQLNPIYQGYLHHLHHVFRNSKIRIYPHVAETPPLLYHRKGIVAEAMEFLHHGGFYESYARKAGMLQIRRSPLSHVCAPENKQSICFSQK